MALSVALPGAALRVTRTAVGRRALQVVLLAGGLFALGLLFGEQAHAADGMAPTTPVSAVQSVTDSVTGSISGAVTGSVTGSVTKPVTGSVTRSVEQSLEKPVAHVVKSAGSSVLGAGSVLSSTVTDVTHVTHPTNVTHLTDSVPGQVVDTVQTPVTDTVDTVQAQVTETVRHVVQPVGELVVQPVVGDVVLPIGDLVETVTGGLTGTTAEILPSLSELPSLPGLPALPGVGGQVPPAAGSAPQQSAGGGADEGVAGQQGTVAGATAAYGPARIGAQAEGVDAHGGRQGVRPVQAPAPAHQAPPGNPTGALGNQSAVDNGGSRHGDAHAVTPYHRVPLRLVPGASAVVTAAETRDRFRDIPVFPG
ncbi:hypothetical protein [Streptomyces sp. NBC_00038]|uniref:hypothetical protein n=1 Tax=Streptomyces sp. NBC_00038 TaxID=2903615 RepID=UPI00225911B1|nr:hypothetical protein [Streptomyces sp. NBC_00038]MCX5560146.1 hypothetical protein [Streptomyces sp. NBC_00038]